MIDIELELLTGIVDDLYALADGNDGSGCWELYDKYLALYEQAKLERSAQGR